MLSPTPPPPPPSPSPRWWRWWWRVCAGVMRALKVLMLRWPTRAQHSHRCTHGAHSTHGAQHTWRAWCGSARIFKQRVEMYTQSQHGQWPRSQHVRVAEQPAVSIPTGQLYVTQQGSCMRCAVCERCVWAVLFRYNTLHNNQDTVRNRSPSIPSLVRAH